MPNEVVTTQAKPEIVKFREQLEQRAGEIRMALPDHITPEKFQRTIITACQSDPELLKADRQSLVLACMKAAQDGLLPDKREAAIVVFKENKKVEGGAWQTRLIATYMPMVYGLRKKILQSGDVSSLEVNVVYRTEVETGKFLYEVGLEPPLRHRPMMELTPEQTTDDQIVAAYSIATMKDGTKAYEVMRRFEIDRVRETSKTGATKDRNGQPRKASGPWLDWYSEMAKKTVMRRHAKTLPQSGDIIVDVEGRELEAGASTAALLASQEADAPQIEHREEELPPHDKETGELHEEQEPKPKRTRRTKAQIEADKEAAAKAAAEPITDTPPNDDPPEEVRKQREAEEREHNGGMTLAESEAAGEEPGDDDEPLNGPHPAEQSANEIISLFERASTIIDLKRYYDESQLDIASMPDEIAQRVEASYQERRTALGGK